MLSNEETSLLIKKAKNGDLSSKEILIEENSPLIKSVIKRYKNKGVEYDDLYQLGSLGFVKAINNFSEDYSVKFSTYAVPMIAGEVKRFLRDDGSIKVSRSIKRNAILIKKFIEEYSVQNGVEPTIDIISNHFQMDRQDIILTMEANTNPLSIDDKVDDEVSIAERVTSDFTSEKLIDKIAIRDLIKELDARDKRIIIMRYYLDKTQSEIANILGVSQVQISRIENKILNAFKNKIDVDTTKKVFKNFK